MKNRLCWLGWMAFALMGTAPGANADPSLAGGLYHSLAVDSTGQVLSWGDDGSGQLGSGRATTVLTPAVVSGLPAGTVRTLAAGVFHSMALLEDGTVLAWGNNAEGVLGDGSTQSHASPLPVLGLPPLRSLHSGERHAVGIDTQGQLWSWGLNHKGQLGHSAHAYQATLAQRVSMADAVVAVRGGGAHTLALTAVGHVWAWGDNQRGQIASASLPSSVQAVRIAFPTAAPAIVAIEAAGDQSYALDGEGGVWPGAITVMGSWATIAPRSVQPRSGWPDSRPLAPSPRARRARRPLRATVRYGHGEATTSGQRLPGCPAYKAWRARYTKANIT